MANAAEGLKNLKTTYADDSVAVARIDLIVDKIETHLQVMNTTDN